MPLWRNALRLAVGTLSVVRVTPPTTIDRHVAGRAMMLAPVVAVLPGLAAAAVVLSGAAVGLPGLVTGVLAVGALALASRGLHLDGLADTADGLAASYDRERALTVMRTGDVGPAGVVTLLVVVVAQAVAIGALATGWRGSIAVFMAVVASRAVLAMCCAATVPPARPTGLGATVAGSVPIAAAVAHALATVAASALMLLALGQEWWRGALAVVVGFAVAAVLLRRCIRRLGGITGDVLGGCVEVALTATLVVLAAHP